MCDAVDLYKHEYEAMRQEISTHTNFANAAVGFELTALGVGLASSAKYSFATLGLALVTSILWLIYLDHFAGIFRAAAYISLVLRPRLIALTGQPVLGWESFLRGVQEVDPTGTAPFPKLPQERVREPRLGLTYMSAFFGLTSPVLLLTFLLSTPLGGRDHWYIWIASTAVLVAWIYASARFFSTAKWAIAVDAMIGGRRNP